MMTGPPDGNETAGGAGTPTGLDTGSREQTDAEDRTVKPWAVFTSRDDGRRRLFNRYATLQEAERVAQTLRNVGCAATAEAAS